MNRLLVERVEFLRRFAHAKFAPLSSPTIADPLICPCGWHLFPYFGSASIRLWLGDGVRARFSIANIPGEPGISPATRCSPVASFYFSRKKNTRYVLDQSFLADPFPCCFAAALHFAADTVSTVSPSGRKPRGQSSECPARSTAFDSATL